MMESTYPTTRDIARWWKDVLKCPKHVIAPMVDASELPWRMLSRRYGADLCFTPMIHSKNFVKDQKYRNENINACKCLEDRPLIMQFCGNDPKVLTEAAIFAKDYCDGIDINLGCPQKIAKTGHYGAFLQDEWKLIENIVKSINQNVGIPISCKIRVFEDVEKTVRYAKMIEAAGCWMLTVHGRTIAQKGVMTGLANWNIIKIVRESVSIPVLANGNIQYLSDVQKCIDATGVNGVMSAEGSLHNPALFAGIQPNVWQVALEYIHLVKQFPCPMSYSRGHLFKIFHHVLVMEDNYDLREALGKGKSIECFEDVCNQLKERYEPYFHAKEWSPKNPLILNLPFPPWICQPYERPPPSVHPNYNKSRNFEQENQTKIYNTDVVVGENTISKKRLKRMNRKGLTCLPTRIRDDRKLEVCLQPDCSNIAGAKCDRKLCRICCSTKCKTEIVDCVGHRIHMQSQKDIGSPEKMEIVDV